MSDADLARRLEKLRSILELAKPMTAERHLDRLLAPSGDEAARRGRGHRCTLFLADRRRGAVKQGRHGEATLRIPIGAGIAGALAASGGAGHLARHGASRVISTALILRERSGRFFRCST